METEEKGANNHYTPIVVSVAFAAFIVNVDEYIVNIALPTVAKGFGVETGAASWVVLSYMLAIVSTMLPSWNEFTGTWGLMPGLQWLGTRTSLPPCSTTYGGRTRTCSDDVSLS